MKIANTLSLEAFELRASDFDAAVRASPDISQVCSSSAWLIAAARSLHRFREVEYSRSGEAWLLLGSTRLPSLETLYHPLEAAWGFSCPLVGRDIQSRLELLAARLEESTIGQTFLLSGIVHKSELFDGLSRRFLDRLTWTRETLECLQADLSIGVENYLARRSTAFRKTLRSSERKFTASGIVIRDYSHEENTDASFTTILEVEKKSWKFEAGQSIFLDVRYRNFYRDLLEICHSQGTLRLLVAFNGDSPCAYVFGSVFNSCYRGFQMGYDNALQFIGLGHILQISMMRKMEVEKVMSFDFGMWAQYKEKWSDKAIALRSCIITTP